MFVPDHEEIYISCAFTWDKEKCEELAYQWEGVTEKPVKLGGPAYRSSVDEHIPGMYIKSNITFTTRGCNNQCPWCVVPRIEGRLRELTIYPGNWIQDNNFLQASRERGICFKGGLQSDLIDDHFTSNITSMRISELWLACDTDGALPQFKTAAGKLVKAGFNREKIKCYVLIGDDMGKNEARLREIYHAGAMPFAQLYRDFSDTKTEYSKEWNAFARSWQRPAAINAHMKQGTDFRDFST